MEKFLYVGNGTVPSWGGEGIVVDPKWLAHFDRNKVRPKFVKFPDRKPTICDPKLRTINTNAECGSKEDFWYHHPWRYPGISPVTDSCGTAGGVLPGQPQGTAGADYTNTKNAKVGDLGSKLPPLPTGFFLSVFTTMTTAVDLRVYIICARNCKREIKHKHTHTFYTGTTWTAGSDVDVSWALKAWHGGGYTYRLAPADGPLTEETFNKISLKFVGNSSLRWGGIGGEQLFFNSTAKGWEVSEGTYPTGSMWRKNPIARTVNEWYMYGASFEPVCDESPECRNSHHRTPAPGVCKCLGDWNDLLEVVDKVYSHLPSRR